MSILKKFLILKMKLFKYYHPHHLEYGNMLILNLYL